MLKRYFLTGLLVLVPLAITVWVLATLIGLMDQSLLLLPPSWRPESRFGFSVPGMGAVLTVLIVLITGILATNFFGKRLILFWEGLLARVPVVKSIYYSVKQVSDTLFSGTGEHFGKVLLVPYPHQGALSIAFQTGTPTPQVAQHSDEELVSVFIPTAPSPVNGFFFFVKKSDTVELDISVDEALKYIVSMGVVVPTPKDIQAANYVGD
ncbi:uncharacterized protein NMK_1088 [Novimethylophilus kurashikiensis]|uniref:DUF502 domain-containing protein n=1 Tax=Novimethylophilus kurashikiensis TaxID=1825523 RepID=A0A2R5F5D1_9PROT|nr:DUF502 domain-containing protein [Novimethylophilus kurashikiensis]GBG13537.1 uncharacterized protein NMK_1088 [Novimethylophilus kurashikiensis]